jgi:hypothetical protein
MLRFGTFGVAMTTLLLLAGGCPTNPGNNSNTNTNGSSFTGPTQLEGTWTGSVACSRTQTVTGANPGNPVSSTKTISIQFGADGRPVNVAVISFSGATDQTAVLQNVGDSVTLNFSDPSGPITEVVSVTEATFTETSTRLVVNIEYSSTSGQLTRTGTGTQTIEAKLENGAVTYSAVVNYNVNLVVGTLNLATTETTNCSGTLAKQ